MTTATERGVRFEAPVRRHRTETRSGREWLVAEASTMPFGSSATFVMKRHRFSRADVAASVGGLRDTPATYEHPREPDGSWRDAMSRKAIDENFINAWNENPRWDESDGRIALDVAIDVEKAMATEKGRRAVEAIRADRQVSTSIGAILRNVPAEGGNFDWDASIARWDHNALLFESRPASSLEEGTGLNAGAEEGELVPMTFSEGDLEGEQRSSGICNTEIIKEALGKLNAALGLGGRQEMADDTKNETKTEAPAAFGADEQKAFADALLTKINESIDERVKPLNDAIAAMQADAKAEGEKARAGAIETLTKANRFDADDMEHLSTDFLVKEAGKIQANAGKGAAKTVEGDADPEADPEDGEGAAFDYKSAIEDENTED